MIRIGTSHFETLYAARRYYRDYDPSLSPKELNKWVADKLNAGEIHIGAPEVKPGQRLSIIPGEGRYQIEDIEPGPKPVVTVAEMAGAIAQLVTVTKPKPPAIELTMTLMVRVGFPDRFGHGWDYSVGHKYGTGHAWAGSYSHTTEHNAAHEAMWEETKPQETCNDPGGAMCWATYELNAVDGTGIGNELDRLEAKICAVIARFPEQDEEHERYFGYTKQCARDCEEPKSFDEWVAEWRAQ